MHVSTVLKDAVVTDVVWEGRGSRVFFGDDQGRIAVSYLPKVQSCTSVTDRFLVARSAS